jgi:hypothetical protein
MLTKQWGLPFFSVNSGRIHLGEAIHATPNREVNSRQYTMDRDLYDRDNNLNYHVSSSGKWVCYSYSSHLTK